MIRLFTETEIIRIFFYLLFFCGCSNKNTNQNNCIYTIKDILIKYDSAGFVIKKYDDDLIEMSDTSNVTGEKGIYKFDKSGNLRFYAYLIDQENNYYFGINYDSLGNEINKPKSYVVRWFINRLNNDSIRVSILLYNLKHSYGKIRFSESNEWKQVPLFESKYFSNLIAGEIIMPNPPTKRVYVSGQIRNNCLNETKIFKDSIIIPF